MPALPHHQQQAHSHCTQGEHTRCLRHDGVNWEKKYVHLSGNASLRHPDACSSHEL